MGKSAVNSKNRELQPVAACVAATLSAAAILSSCGSCWCYGFFLWGG